MGLEAAFGAPGGALEAKMAAREKVFGSAGKSFDVKTLFFHRKMKVFAFSKKSCGPGAETAASLERELPNATRAYISKDLMKIIFEKNKKEGA